MSILPQPGAGLIPGYMTDIDSYYKMPPVGITETRGRIGEVRMTNYTARCGNSSCWFVGHATTDADAQALLDQHACPTPPARNELPTGLSTIEKLWDELDAGMQAINEQTGWGVGGRVLNHNDLRSYVLGLCFSLSMMTHPHFRTVNDVLKEGQRRYKMRKGVIPYQPTPTYRNNPLPLPTQPPAGRREAYHGETRDAVARTTAAPRTRAARSQPTKVQLADAAAVDMSSVTPEMRQRIINGVKLMGMPHDEVASMFNVTVQTVRVLVDGLPS